MAAAAWVLLIGGLRRDVEILTERGPTTDQGRLQKITHIPAYVWVVVFLVFGVFALVIGARWLLF